MNQEPGQKKSRAMILDHYLRTLSTAKRYQMAILEMDQEIASLERELKVKLAAKRLLQETLEEKVLPPHLQQTMSYLRP